jgi:putative tryptophan/tyrosine transport system substrate-binding protein
MKRRQFISLLGGAVVAYPLGARAQQSDQLRRIGVLMGTFEGDPAGESRLAAFRAELAKRGWTEGRNLRIDVRWGADAHAAQLERYAADLVALGPDVLVSEANQPTAALRSQTRTIPIVFMGVADPAGQGKLVASLAHPGGNITGFTIFDPPMAGKWLEMLTQIKPPATHVTVLYNPTPFSSMALKTIEQAASSLAVPVQAAPVGTDPEIEAAMAQVAREAHGGIVVFASPFTMTHRDAIVSLAAKHRLPAVYAAQTFATAAGLMSYGVEPSDLVAPCADYVDRILKGAKPADMPVQQPTKFRLVINLKTAKSLGITIPDQLIALADEVIE